MNYADCQSIGVEGCELVMQWLKSRGRVFDGRMVRTDKGRIALFLQKSVGDILYNTDPHTVLSIEVKTERRSSPNLFLETWSNACPERKKPGWMVTLDADWLFYYFADSDDLCTVDFQRLKQWAFGEDQRICNFPEKEQVSNRQLNRTMGRIVPICLLGKEVGLRVYHPLRDLGLTSGLTIQP